MRKSIDCFEGALRLDPGLAAAHDALCDAHTMLACRGMAPAVESFHKAKAGAREADGTNRAGGRQSPARLGA